MSEPTATELMQRLRNALDVRGIAWEDHPMHSFEVGVFMERTRFTVSDVEFSVIWGYKSDSDGVYGITEGWPNELECWCRPRWDEPRPVNVCDILVLVDEMREGDRHGYLHHG